MNQPLGELLIQMIFGFPAVFLSLLLSAIGILKEKFWLVIIGAVLLLPFSYYLNGSPGLRGFIIFLPLFQVGSAVAIRQKSKLLAWLLLLPAFLVTVWVVGLALAYQLV